MFLMLVQVSSDGSMLVNLFGLVLFVNLMFLLLLMKLIFGFVMFFVVFLNMFLFQNFGHFSNVLRMIKHFHVVAIVGVIIEAGSAESLHKRICLFVVIRLNLGQALSTLFFFSVSKSEVVNSFSFGLTIDSCLVRIC